eukprot:4871-Amphidinium_carterae.1
MQAIAIKVQVTLVAQNLRTKSTRQLETRMTAQEFQDLKFKLPHIIKNNTMTSHNTVFARQGTRQANKRHDAQ